MARNLYCWRCDMELPMLDEDEWAQLEPLLRETAQDFMEVRRATGVGLEEAQANGILGRRALVFYRELTGFDETNINALWHHRLADYGPPCAHCGKPLRTPRAKLCAACWHPREASSSDS